MDLLQRRVVKQGKSLRGCFVVLSALLLPSSAVSPWGAPVGLVGPHAAICEKEMRGRVSAQSHGEVSHLW